MTTETSQPRTRAEIGLANREKGIRAERELSRWLRVHGWPAAERKIDNGWRAADRESADLGDIRGTPGIVWQVKVRDHVSTLDIHRFLAEAGDQAVAAEADYGIVVLRREGKANPADWWAYVCAGDIASLILAAEGRSAPAPQPDHQKPVRLELGDLLPLLHSAGYGQVDA